jgi:hypothetical protein
VARGALGDALDESDVGVGVGRSPCQAVGVEEARRQQERGSLVGVWQRMVPREMLEEYGGLSISVG